MKDRLEENASLLYKKLESVVKRRSKDFPATISSLQTGSDLKKGQKEVKKKRKRNTTDAANIESSSMKFKGILSPLASRSNAATTVNNQRGELCHHQCIEYSIAPRIRPVFKRCGSA